MFSKIKEYLSYGKDHTVTVIVKGLFWLAPIAAITIIVIWMYEKVNILTGGLFKLVGFEPTNFPILWTFIGLALLAFLAEIRSCLQLLQW